MSAAPAPAISVSTPEKSPPVREAVNEELRWQPLLGLPCDLSVDLPLPKFKVADFLKLQAGSVIGAQWRLSHDVPLRVNGTLIGWGEIEGSEGRLAVRLTELA